MRVLSPDVELTRLGTGNHERLSRAVMDMARAQARGKGEDKAFEKLHRLLTQILTLADLIGRKRLYREVDAAKPQVPKELAEQLLFTADVLEPAVGFASIVNELIRREPRLAGTAETVAALYRKGLAFAMAKSTSLAVTRKVRSVLASLAGQGKSSADLGQAVAVLGGWSEAYADTVVRTNLSTAYTQGRIEEVKRPGPAAVMSAFEVIGSNDSDTRRGRKEDGGENHLAALGLIASVHDPIWQTHTPPYGYNCRHTLRAVSKFELKRRGLISENGVVMRSVPRNFSAFRAHPNFS